MFLITGARGQLGSRLANHLLAAGYELCLVVRSEGLARQRFEAELRERFPRARFSCWAGHLPEALPHLWRHLCRHHASWRGVVHGASIFRPDRPESIRPEALWANLAIHLETPILLTQALRAFCLARAAGDLPGDPSGRVVFLLDAKLLNLNANFASYSLSKLALAGFHDMVTQAFRDVLGSYALYPGVFAPNRRQSPASFRRLAHWTASGQCVELHDLVRTIELCLTGAIPAGTSLPFDAGWRLM